MSRPRRLAPVDFAAAIAADPLLRDLAACAGDLPGRILLVGGAPRDMFLERVPRDLDFILAAPLEAAESFLETFRSGLEGRLLTFDSKGVRERRLVAATRELDFVLVEPQGLEAEIRRRDFTLNALAVELPDGSLHDPCGGLADLRAGLLRQVSETAFREDPLRTLRAVRLLAEGVAWRLDPPTRRQLQRAAAGLAACAGERIAVEMDRLAASSHFAASLALMQRWGLLAAVAPEAAALVGVTQNEYHHLDCWRHTLAAVARTDGLASLATPLADEDTNPLVLPVGEDLLVLKYAVLCHDMGKPATRSTGPDGRVHFYVHEKVSVHRVRDMAARWRFSRVRTRRISALVRHHLRPGALGPGAGEKAMRRLIHAAGSDLDLLLLLSLADNNATRGIDHPARQASLELFCRRLRRVAEQAGEELMAPRPLLNGHAIMRLTGLAAGPRLGAVVSGLVRLQVEGEVTTRRQAETAVRRLATRLEDDDLQDPPDP
ncbi:MAG: HD domain-containing protein [Acidobacteria bacterium]|nr:HD domain-containing protein [Acidobacteriota bacterium]